MGRPSKLTAETSRKILDVIAAGGTRAVAAQAAGVHRGTLNEWLRRGEDNTQTALNPDDYTTLELRALGKTQPPCGRHGVFLWRRLTERH